MSSSQTAVWFGIAVIGSVLTTLIVRLKNIKLCRCCGFNCEQTTNSDANNLQVITPADIINSAMNQTEVPQLSSKNKSKFVITLPNKSVSIPTDSVHHQTQTQTQTQTQNPQLESSSVP